MKTLIAIVGPTAVGKTTLSVKLAKHFSTEVVSADSRQIYREMSIGTAKPTAAEMEGVRHHFIDELTVDEEYSVGRYETDALLRLKDIFSRNDIAILCGGSGLYVQAVTEGLDEIPAVDPDIRKQLINQYEENGIEVLQKELKEADPAYFEEVDLNNPQRLMRALEVIRGTGMTFSSFRIKDKKVRDFNVIKIGLELPREELYERAEMRMDQMIDNGLEDEVKALTDKSHLNALQTVGYQELFSYLQGEYDRDEAIGLLKRNTRRYAKRQLTWFKRDSEVKWFSPFQLNEILAFINEQLKKQGKT